MDSGFRRNDEIKAICRNPQFAKLKKLALSKRIWIPVFTGMTVNLTTPPSKG